jgi:hypothetical protein
MTAQKIGVLIALALAVPTLGGCAAGECPEFDPCSPRSGPRGAEAVVVAQSRLIGASIYWLGPSYETSDFVFVGQDPFIGVESAVVHQSGGPSASLKISGSGGAGFTIVATLQGGRQFPNLRGGSRLLLVRPVTDTRSVAVYADYPGPPSHDGELREIVERDLQTAPYTLDELQRMSGRSAG